MKGIHLPRVARPALVPLILSVLVSAGCATLGVKTYQKIPVTVDPPGATVTVDGRESGTAPLTLELKRDVRHVIEIEREGYQTLTVIVMSRPSRPFLLSAGILAGGTLLGVLAAETFRAKSVDEEDARNNRLVGGVIGFAVSAVFVARRETQSALTPASLSVALKKIKKGESPVRTLVLAPEEIPGIRWIRVGYEPGL